MPFDVFTWTPVPGLNPMVRLHPPSETASVAATRIIDELAPIPVGKRYLLVLNEVPSNGYDGREDWDRTDPAHFVAQGPRWGVRQDWFLEVFWKIRNETPIDHIVVDNESGFSNWHIATAANHQKILDDPAALAKLPAYIASLNVANIYNLSDKNAVNAWNRWAGLLYSTYLRRLLVNTFRDATGYTPTISNFNELLLEPGARVYDPNNWPLTPGIMVNTSAPVMYWETGLPFGGPSYVRHPVSNAEVDSLIAHIIACDATKGIYPWVAFLSWYGEPILRYLLDRLEESNITKLLLWNPQDANHSNPTDDATFASIIAEYV